MIDYYLRFINQTKAAVVLHSVGIHEGTSTESAVDHVGEIVLVPAVMDGYEEKTPATIDTRHHVNLRTRRALHTTQLEQLSEYLVHPVKPVRVWA